MKLTDAYKNKRIMPGKLSDIKLDDAKTGDIIAIARHGSTNSNGDKVFRGWNETPDNQLTNKGVHDAMRLGQDIKKMVGNKPDKYVIVSSDLNRAIDTARIASDVSGVPTGKQYASLRSQDTGIFTGQKEEKVKKQVIKHIENSPDQPLPGATESHTEFVTRVKEALKPNGIIEKDYPNKKIIPIVHHQVEILHKNNFGKTTESMFQGGIQPGELRKL